MIIERDCKNINFDRAKWLMHAAADQRIQNYVVPGLVSALIGGSAPNGTKVRVFESTIQQREHVTPHSHRFDFIAHVLCGSVHNTVWEPMAWGEQMIKSELTYDGKPGKYTKKIGHIDRFASETKTYRAGDWYDMQAEEIHSIVFDESTVVLVIEGPTFRETTTILEPCIDGKHIPTFKVQPWMFQSEAN